jgi:aminoglycoside/choline kinase family phosphotransferase/choline kinase
MNKDKICAMVLAAGYGTRLRPMTDIVPKPLVPLANKPLIEIVLSKLIDSGINDIAVNTHHQTEKIQGYLNKNFSKHVTVFHEPEILGTGGGISNASSFLKKYDHFIIHNSDVVSDISIDAVLEHHLETKAMVTMALTESGVYDTVSIDADGKVSDIGSRRDKETDLKRTYTGISVFSAEALSYFPDGASNYVDIIINILNDGHDVAAYVPENANWNDIGTFKRYIQANRDMLSDDQLLVEQGSDRKFYRLTTEGASFVLMESGDSREEFDRFVSIGLYLNSIDLCPPIIYGHDSTSHSAIIEDLGDEDLFNIISGGNDKAPLYRQVIDYLIVFQQKGTVAIKECPDAGNRSLDYDVLRWETDYFRHRFLQDIAGIAEAELTSLDDEFHVLAEYVSNQQQVLVHRDFQSRNIMIKDGAIRIIDFQGARLGPYAYDLMSLIRDPYICPEPELQDELLHYYHENSPVASGIPYKEFMNAAVTCGLQRNMQALGAYGFLSKVKGKQNFLEYVKPGLMMLEAGLADLESSDIPFRLEFLKECVARSI